MFIIQAREFTFDKIASRLLGQPGAWRRRAIALPVHFARGPETVVTLEGPVDCVAGDAIVTGVHGERWPLHRATFERLYAARDGTAAGVDGLYTRLPMPVQACQLGEPCRVVFNAARTLEADRGDWIVQRATGELSVVKPEAFDALYEAQPAVVFD